MSRGALGSCLLVVLGLLLLMTSTAGCRGRTAKNAGKGGAIEIDEGPILTLDTGDGKVQAKIGEAELASIELAEDVPRYEPAAHSLASKTPKGALVSFSATAAPADVAQFYADELPQSGWTIESRRSSSDGTVIAAAKDDRRVVVSIEAEAGGAKVTLAADEP